MLIRQPGLKTTTSILVFLWLLIQAILLIQLGIVTKGEALKYTNEAKLLDLNHGFSQPKYLFYSIYIFVRWLDLQLHSNNLFTYCLQLALNFLACSVFFKYATTLFKDYFWGGIATLLIILCLPWQQWTVHLYTESVFLSLVLLFFCYFTKSNKTKADKIIAIGCLILLIFTRPTGLLLIPAVAIWLWVQSIKSKKWVVLAGLPLMAGIVFYLLLNYAMKGEGEFDFMKPFIEEHLICGVPTGLKTELQISKNGNSIEGLLFYISHNFGHFINLALKKLTLFFGLTRSYYSSPHNLAIQLFFYPIYLLAIGGIVLGWKKYRRVIFFCLLLTGVFAGSVVLTCDDWLNRFIMPVLPIILLLAATGIKELFIRVLISKPK